MVGIIPVITSNNAMRAVYGVAATTASLVLYDEVKPFEEPSVNILAKASHLAVFFVYGSALCLEVHLFYPSYEFGAVLIIVTLMVVLFALTNGLKRIAMERRLRQSLLERRAIKIEWACHFNKVKFDTTFASVRSACIPPSHALVFYYSTNTDALAALKSGIPCNVHHGGVVFSLDHHLELIDSNYFSSKEVVLACSVPRKLLKPLHMAPANLRLLSSDILRAVRGDDFSELVDPHPWYSGEVFFPPGSIVRSYLCVDVGASDSHANILAQGVVDLPLSTETPPFFSPRTCMEFVESMTDVRAACLEHGLSPLYHYTTPFAAKLITATGFRMSTQATHISHN